MTSNALGGSVFVLGLSLTPAPGIALGGGLVWIDPATVFLFPVLPLLWTAGVAGAGSAAIALPLPAAVSLGGVRGYFQAFVADSLEPQGISMTPGLDVTVCR
jgi:hypothetical protein